MSPPEQPRRFFVDRSLGRIAAPKLLREAGRALITLAEHYGVPRTPPPSTPNGSHAASSHDQVAGTSKPH